MHFPKLYVYLLPPDPFFEPTNPLGFIATSSLDHLPWLECVAPASAFKVQKTKLSLDHWRYVGCRKQWNKKNAAPRMEFDILCDGRKSWLMQPQRTGRLRFNPWVKKVPWRILWTEEPGRLQSMGSQTVRHNWATDTHQAQENQLWMFIGRINAEAPILWPPDAKRQLIGKDPDAGKDWGQEEKGETEDEMVGGHHWLNGHEFEQAPGVGDGQGRLACCSPWGLQRVGHDWAPERQWTKNREVSFSGSELWVMVDRRQEGARPPPHRGLFCSYNFFVFPCAEEMHQGGPAVSLPSPLGWSHWFHKESLHTFAYPFPHSYCLRVASPK